MKILYETTFSPLTLIFLTKQELRFFFFIKLWHNLRFPPLYFRSFNYSTLNGIFRNVYKRILTRPSEKVIQCGIRQRASAHPPLFLLLRRRDFQYEGSNVGFSGRRIRTCYRLILTFVDDTIDNGRPGPKTDQW